MPKLLEHEEARENKKKDRSVVICIYFVCVSHWRCVTKKGKKTNATKNLIKSCIASFCTLPNYVFFLLSLKVTLTSDSKVRRMNFSPGQYRIIAVFDEACDSLSDGSVTETCHRMAPDTGKSGIFQRFIL